MKAEMRSKLPAQHVRTSLPLSVRDGWRDVVFTVAQARHALPYVARVARDAAQSFDTAQRCRRLLVCTDGRRARLALCEQRDRALQRLNSAIDECNAVGAHLVDLDRGTVSFQSEVNGHPACLVWRLDDPIDGAWSEVDKPEGRASHAAARNNP